MGKKSTTNGLGLTAAAITKTLTTKPEIALVLGSGLGRFAERLQVSQTFHTAELPHYPRLSVEGHLGKIHFGTLTQSGKTSLPLIVFEGRVHYYESGSLELTTFPIDLAHRLGARLLLVTNAAGGVNRTFKPGDLMLIQDFLSLSFLAVPSQKKASQKTSLRPFKRSESPFDEGLQAIALESAKTLSIQLRRGVYCWLKGPSYETPAEIEMLSRIGVDAVGMSTIPEVVRALNHRMKVLGISVISNMAAGISAQKLSHSEVTETTSLIRKDFEDLITNVVLAMR